MLRVRVIVPGMQSCKVHTVHYMHCTGCTGCTVHCTRCTICTALGALCALCTALGASLLFRNLQQMLKIVTLLTLLMMRMGSTNTDESIYYLLCRLWHQ